MLACQYIYDNFFDNKNILHPKYKDVHPARAVNFYITITLSLRKNNGDTIWIAFQLFWK